VQVSNEWHSPARLCVRDEDDSHNKELGTESEMSCKRVINPQEGEDSTKMNVWPHIYITFPSLRLQTAHSDHYQLTASPDSSVLRISPLCRLHHPVVAGTLSLSCHLCR
jgi:hypothetical protein